MRTLLLTCMLANSARAQTGQLGFLTDSRDIGNPAIKGTATFDAAKNEYHVTAGGAVMWGRTDEFHYVWRELSGDFVFAATMSFLGAGFAHRKAGIMLRQSTATDSPYADLVVHGDGMPSVHWRNAKGDITNAADFPFSGPGTFRLKLVRQGNTIIVSVAKDGVELRELVRTQVQLGNPLLVGLAVCSHQANAAATVVFSDVSLELLSVAAAKQ